MTENQPDTFVAQLREERLQRNIHQKDMAGSLGFNTATLSGYENGASHPRIDLLREWAYALDYELTMTRIEKPVKGRRRNTTSADASDIPEDLNPVYLSKYQTALAMGMLIAQAQTMREDSPAMAADVKMIADILARSIH